MAGEQEEVSTDNGATDQVQQMSPEDIAKMITGATERTKKAQAAEFAAQMKEFTASIPTLLKAQLEELKLQGKPEDKPTDNKPNPEMLALQQKLAAMEAGMKERDTALAEADKRSKADAARNELRAALAPHVRPDALDMTAQLLFDAQKRVNVSEDGQAVFKLRQSPMAGMPEEDMELPIKDGIATWLKSDDAKFFLPAPSAPQADARRGSPLPQRGKVGADGMPSYDGPATTDEERVRRADERAVALAAKYPHLNDQL